MPSVEPSSTTISSNGTPSSAEATREQNSRASPSSSSIGATTLRSRNSRIGASLASGAHVRVVPPGAGCEHVFVSYAELHAHSAFSFLDGASLPDELAGAAAELGYGAMALTDHNSVSGSMEFAQAAGALGLRAIHGAEMDLDDGRHLTLLVEDARGLAQPVPDPHARARAHARARTSRRRRSRWRRSRRTRRGWCA